MKMFRIIAAILALFFSLSSFAEGAGPKVLVFSKTAAIRNGSIPEGIAALKVLGAQRGWRVDATEDSGRFTDASLRTYDVVVWLNTSGNVLNPKQQVAYEAFHRSGKGTVAVHSGGVDTETEGWPWYRKMASTLVESRPAPREVTVMNFTPTHLGNFVWPYIRRQTEQWYPLSSNPYSDAHVLLVAYDPTFPEFGLFLPISWYKEYDGGRYFYTMLGGLPQDYSSDRSFLAHLAGGIEWAAARAPTNISRSTEGKALILNEFDGMSPNGVWDKQAPSEDFIYSVKPGELDMEDSSAVSMVNRHLVRRGITIDPQRPYAIEGDFQIPAPLDWEHKPYSFCVNLNVAGADGDPRRVSTWAVNIHVLRPGKSVSKFMGFIDGGFFQVGQVENEWGEAGTEYHFEIHMNADLQGLPRAKMVSLRVKYGETILESFETDYSGFPYQPDPTKPVRFGLNGHGTAWVLRNLKLYYLDVPAPAL